MIKKQFKKFLLLSFLFVLPTINWSQLTTFSYTGTSEIYTVPAGVNLITIKCWGAEGISGLGAVGGTAGLGGYAEGELAVTPGQTLNIYVGGQDGFNGGGVGGNIGAGNGGGASDVRIGGVLLTNRYIVAGGAGGGGSTGCAADWAGGTGGAGGGLPGTNGVDSPNGGGGFGGTAGAGGAEGIGCASFLGTPGLADGTGGNGQGCCCATTPGGGGGGGGFVVGGGGGGGSAGTVGCSGNDKGGGGGGAGGTSFTHVDFTEVVISNGIRSGNGLITIEPVCTEPTVTVSDTEICLGESFTLNASGTGTFTWDGGVINGTPFTPASIGIVTYTSSSDDISDCPYSVAIEVFALPVVTASVDVLEICLGDSIILTGGGADTYVWDPAAVTDGAYYTPAATGTIKYIVTGTDAVTTCENKDSVEVNIYDALAITYSTIEELDAGSNGEIDLTVTGGNPTYTFDWDNDGTGDFDDTEDLTGLSAGVYVVVVKDDASCEATESITVNSQTSGIGVLNKATLLVFPNPTSSDLTVTFNGKFNYEITTISGDVLLSGVGVDKKEISLDQIASGTYFIVVESEGNSKTMKIVKN